jgi:hypothetical protein
VTNESCARGKLTVVGTGIQERHLTVEAIADVLSR